MQNYTSKNPEITNKPIVFEKIIPNNNIETPTSEEMPIFGTTIPDISQQTSINNIQLKELTPLDFTQDSEDGWGYSEYRGYDINNDGNVDYKLFTGYDEQGNIKYERHSYKGNNNDGNYSLFVNYQENGNIDFTNYHQDTNDDGINEYERIIEYDENGIACFTQETEYINGAKSKTTVTQDENKDGTIDFEMIETYDSNNMPTIEKYSYDYEINGIIENSEQNLIGDCWLLSGLNALSNTSFGSEIIKNAITDNNDGTYSIHFKVPNTSFTITEEEIIEAKSRNIYSKGDADMLIMELAFEKIFKSQNTCLNYPSLVRDILNSNKDTEENPLDSGCFGYVTYLLTGEKTDSISTRQLAKFNPKETPTYLSCPSGTSIKDIEGNEIILCDGYDSSHAWSVKSIEEGIATIINPHDSSKEVKVTIDNLNKCKGIKVEILNVKAIIKANKKEEFWKNVGNSITEFFRKLFNL